MASAMNLAPEQRRILLLPMLVVLAVVCCMKVHGNLRLPVSVRSMPQHLRLRSLNREANSRLRFQSAKEARTDSWCGHRLEGSGRLRDLDLRPQLQVWAAPEDSSAEKPPTFKDKTEPLTREKAKAANKETADKLIAVFLKQEQGDWKHLLGFSQQWWEIADSVFERITERADASSDPDEELSLRRLGRKLQETHDDVYQNRKAWNELMEQKEIVDIEKYIQANMERISSPSFFEYMRDVVGRADHNDEVSEVERSKVRALANQIMELTQDLAIGVDDEVRTKMSAVLNAGSKEAAKSAIDKLAESGDLDPRYLALMAKGYADGKETWFTKEDHEETTLYMYEQMRESMRKQQPLEIRLLKYVLAFPTPRERKEALEEVLKPGVKFDDEGWYTAETTSPEAMLLRVEDLLRKYRLNVERFGELEPRPINRAIRKKGDLQKEDIMRDLVVDSVYMYVPEVMERLREIRELIKSEFAGQLPENITPDNKKKGTPDNTDVILQGDNFMPF